MRNLISKTFPLILISFLLFSCIEEEQQNNVRLLEVPMEVVIESNTCIDRGESLIPIDPNSDDYYAYQDKTYEIRWFVNGKPAGTSYELSCVCGADEYSVKVINTRSGEEAEASTDVMPCPDQGVK